MLNLKREFNKQTAALADDDKTELKTCDKIDRIVTLYELLNCVKMPLNLKSSTNTKSLDKTQFSSTL
jgi:hypothetical protein